MSLYSALYSGVSGLSAEATAMAGVADNITNINTVGYKGIDTGFRTLVTEGRSGTSYSAGGLQAFSSPLISKQGLLQASSSTTDLGIDGAGFFVARDLTGATTFTRDGSFKPDQQGFLRNSGGFYLQGWPLDASGNYVNTGNLSVLQPVKLSNLNGTAAATSKIQLRANLQSTTAAHTGAYTAGDMATGTTTPDFTRAVTAYDQQGGAHQLSFSFLKTGANSWKTEVYAVPASEVAQTNGLLASGTLAFNPDGSLNVAGSSPALFGTVTPTWTNAAGALPIKLDLGDASTLNGLTQFGGTSALVSSSVDGGLQGNLSSISVSKAGVVSAVFDDGSSRAVFQLPIATFPNPDGMTRVSGNAYTVSGSSGNPAINPPGALGAGAISPSTLEASNVDLAGEFTNMIRFQRAYSASSKIITTVDEMLQEVSNLKR